jgi:hypothetical protein
VGTVLGLHGTRSPHCVHVVFLKTGEVQLREVRHWVRGLPFVCIGVSGDWLVVCDVCVRCGVCVCVVVCVCVCGVVCVWGD